MLFEIIVQYIYLWNRGKHVNFYLLTNNSILFWNFFFFFFRKLNIQWVYKSSNIFSEMHVVFLWFSSFFMQLLVYTHTHTHMNEGSSLNLFSIWIYCFPNSNPRLHFCIMLISQKSSKQDLSLNPNEKTIISLP